MKILLTIVQITLLALPLPAEILLLATTPSDTYGACDGTITVRATGSAGPFTIFVYDHVQDREIERVGVTGDITLSGLCNASYDVEVYPTRFPGCGKVMKAYVQQLKRPGQSPTDAFGEVPEGAFRVSVSPNPTDGPVMVSIEGWPPAAKTAALTDGSLRILDATGKTIRSLVYPASRNGAKRPAPFPLDLTGLEQGLYFVRVVRSDGVEGVGKVLLQ